MELQLLRAFVAVARHGSVTRATQALFLSQPAVSAQVKALEEEVHLQLFDRTSQGMTLTPAGTALLPLAERLLGEETRLLAEAGRLSGSFSGRLRLGMPAATFLPSLDPGTLRLAELLKRISMGHPALLVDVHHGTSASILEDVGGRRLDLGLVVGPAGGDGLAQLRVKSLVVYVAAPAAWREEIARRGWEPLMRSPWVAGAEDSYCGRAARERAHDPSRIIEVDHPGAVLELVGAGLCVGLLHEEDALEAEQAGTVLLWKERPLRAELSFVWSAEAAGQMPLAAVLPIVRDLWRA
ncbi:MAG TPA: LysR family transcriptional regulator [Anaeromyxobacteraceae bacterium]|nr:LysR family transcriptional regulator [Anaeromyxobacteraceae bacterium]